jgi:hypothetical protein
MHINFTGHIKNLLHIRTFYSMVHAVLALMLQSTIIHFLESNVA